MGKGVLHPDAVPIRGLPNGSIRNSDLGMMQLLMTMGVTGVMVLLGLILSILWPSLQELWSRTPRHWRSDTSPSDEALVLGCTSCNCRSPGR